MSSKQKKEIQKFFDKAECYYSTSYLKSIQSKLNLAEVVQAAKFRVIQDILLIKSL